MVLTSHSISSINKTIDYCLQPSKISNVLCSDGLDLTGLSLNNYELHDTSIVKNDFLLYQNKRLKKPYLSLIISPEVNLSNDKLKEIVNDTLMEMKLDNHQMIAITHEELRGEEKKTPVKHVHILINRVDFNENTYNDSYIGLKGIKAISHVSQKHNLKDVYNSREYGTKKMEKQNSEFHSEKTISINKLRTISDLIINNKSTFSIDDIFLELRQEHAIDVQITKFNNGRFGVLFNTEGQSIKASEVSRLLTVIPYENGYKANRHLQLILDEHLFETRTTSVKTQEEIYKSYEEHENFDLLMSDLTNLTALLKADLRNKSIDKDENNEDFLRRKHRRKGKQLGFKVKI